MSISIDNLYLLYFLIGVAFIFSEIFFFTFYLLPIGMAILVTGLFAIFNFNFAYHALVFSICAILFLYAIGKWKKSKFFKQTDVNFHVSLVGQRGVVSESYKSPQKPGKVKVFSDEWEMYLDGQNDDFVKGLKIDDAVVVAKVLGNKVVVKKNLTAT